MVGRPAKASAGVPLMPALDWQPPGAPLGAGGPVLPGGRVPEVDVGIDSVATARPSASRSSPASTNVPEPATVSLIGAGLLALVVTVGRRRRAG